MLPLNKNEMLKSIRDIYEVDSVLKDDSLSSLLANPDFVSDLIVYDDNKEFKVLLYKLHNAARGRINDQ